MTATIVNVTQAPYNASPGSDCTAALQQAHDDLNALGGGTLYLPGSTGAYQLSKPWFVDGSHIRITGDGYNSHIQALNAQTAVLVGVTRTPNGASLSSAHFVSSTGVLDSSASGKTGLRTNGDSSLGFVATPANYGPSAGNFWRSLNGFTLDLAVYLNATYSSTTPLCGLLSRQKPTPFALLAGNTGVTFQVQTSDATVRQVVGPVLTGGLHRISAQVDFANATLTIWLDGTQQATTSIPANLAFVTNEFAAFCVGALSFSALGYGDLYGPNPDITVFGLKLTASALYQVRGNGTSQARNDFTTINDASQFFGAENATFFLLPLTDTQSSTPGGRLVAWTSKVDNQGYGYFLSATHQSLGGANTSSYCSLDNLYISGANKFGQPVAHGWALNFSMSGITLQGGAHNFGCLSFGSSYPIRLENVLLTGSADAAAFAYQQIAWWGRVQIQNYGRTAIRLYDASLSARDLFAAEQAGCETWLKFHSGSNGQSVDLSSIVADFESVGPSVAYLSLESGLQPVIASARDCRFGLIPTGAKGVSLLDQPGQSPGSLAAAAFLAQNNVTNNHLGTPVTNSSSNWTATVT